MGITVEIDLSGNGTGVDPTSQSTSSGGTTTTTASAYDFVGGTTIMSGMTLSAVPEGNYLLYFNTSVSHSAANDVISATIEIEGVQISNAEVDWRRGGSQGDIITQLCFVGFPITLGSAQDINIHWIEVTGGTATAIERSLSIIKVL